MFGMFVRIMYPVLLGDGGHQVQKRSQQNKNAGDPWISGGGGPQVKVRKRSLQNKNDLQCYSIYPLLVVVD